MSVSIEQQLKTTKRDLQEAKNQEVRLETRLDEAKKRRKEVNQKIKDRGYDPKDLPKIIAEKEDELKKTIEEAKQYLPSDEEEFDEDDEF